MARVRLDRLRRDHEADAATARAEAEEFDALTWQEIDARLADATDVDLVVSRYAKAWVWREGAPVPVTHDANVPGTVVLVDLGWSTPVNWKAAERNVP
jgi:hypothetical protein